MRSFLVKCIVAASLCVGVLCFGATTAFAATVDVKPSQGGDAWSAIQTELDNAKEKATDADPVTVKVASGSYKLSRTLNIYSNTTLELTGVSLKATSTTANMIKVGSPSVDEQRGYAYKNISIVGGDLDCNRNSSTGIAIGHGKNITLKNLSLHNTKDAHLVEVAGTDGFTVDNCKFYDQSQNPKAKTPAPEAIQIDIHVKKHMKTYRSEALPMKNIVIKNSTFKNVPRGVGSHTAILNAWVDNVKITGNTFTNCKSGAIQVMYYKNCLIEGNTINSAPRGILVYTVSTKGMFFASTAAKEGGVSSSLSNAYIKPPAKQNIVVRNNKITLKGADMFANSENEGILISGFNFTSALKKNSATDAIPKGNYYASGVTVSGNTIKTTGHGIRLSDTRNSTVTNNKITFVSGGKNTNLYGIQLINASTNNVVKGNTVQARTNGIFVTTGSSASSIEGNTITSAGKYGIAVEGASATSIKGNTIKKAVTNGIYILRSSKVDTITKNTITKVTSGSGINVDAKSTVKQITSNTVKSVKLSGIYVHKNSKSNLVSKNKITGATKYGIFVEGGSTVSKITSNVIQMSKAKAINVKSGKSSISKNKTK